MIRLQVLDGSANVNGKPTKIHLQNTQNACFFNFHSTAINLMCDYFNDMNHRNTTVVVIKAQQVKL